MERPNAAPIPKGSQPRSQRRASLASEYLRSRVQRTHPACGVTGHRHPKKTTSRRSSRCAFATAGCAQALPGRRSAMGRKARILRVLCLAAVAALGFSAPLTHAAAKTPAGKKTTKSQTAPKALSKPKKPAVSAKTSAAVRSPVVTSEGIATVLGKPIPRKDKPKLAAIVSAALLYHYAQKHQIAPSREEVEAYIQHSTGFDRRLRGEWERDAKQLRREMNGPGLSEGDRRQKAAQVEAIDHVLQAHSESEFWRQTHPEETDAAERAIATQALIHWKVNQALFAKYGGDVVVKHTGPLPQGALHAFFEEAERVGNLQLASDGKDAFWKAFKVEPTDTVLSGEEAAQAIYRPPWLRTQF